MTDPPSKPAPDPSQQTTEDMTAAEIEARHCLGMCQDWAWHPAYEGEDHAGLRDFLTRCGEGLRWQMDEIERLRAALRRIGSRAVTADEMGVRPGAEYWCSIAEDRLQIAREALGE